MNIEQINPISLTLDMAIKEKDSLFYIVKGDDEQPYKLLSFSKEGLNLPSDNYILVKLTGASHKETKPVSEEKEEPIKKEVTPKKRLDRDYKFTGMNDAETIRITWAITGNKYGGIRISFPNKEDANDYHDYFREQFYNRDISSIDIASIYEDLGISKERIEQECPGAMKWGYPALKGGACKYMTATVTKNKNDNWYGFTFLPPVIINGMEESGWLAKERALDELA